MLDRDCELWGGRSAMPSYSLCIKMMLDAIFDNHGKALCSLAYLLIP